MNIIMELEGPIVTYCNPPNTTGVLGKPLANTGFSGASKTN
jgi:hypothetical protein